jgi:hypothetical protein
MQILRCAQDDKKERTELRKRGEFFRNSASRLLGEWRVFVLRFMLRAFRGGTFMQRQVLCLVVSLLTLPAFAQTKNPVSAVIKDMLPNRTKNLEAAIESMPADKFNYKPTEGQMTFGHLVVHIIESNYTFCSNAADATAPKVAELKESDSKEKLVAGVKASFDFCATALDKVDDSKLGDTIEPFSGRKVPRAWAFVVLASSWADHYAEVSQYLRLNGVLPPTAQKK